MHLLMIHHIVGNYLSRERPCFIYNDILKGIPIKFGFVRHAIISSGFSHCNDNFITNFLRLSDACASVTWRRHQMETFSALLAICAGNSPVLWWLETPVRPLWRHCNETGLRWWRLAVSSPTHPNHCWGFVNCTLKDKYQWDLKQSRIIFIRANAFDNVKMAAIWSWPPCVLVSHEDGNPWEPFTHYNDVILGAMASQITSLTIVYSTVYSDTDQRKHQSSASLAFVRGIHRSPVNSPHKWPINA